MSYPQGPQYGYPQQQPGYPAPQGGYPQPGGYPPGYPPPQPPRKNNTGLIVTLAGVAAAAVIALVLVLTLSGKDDTTNTADAGTVKPGSDGNAPAATLPGKTKPSGAGSSSGGARALAEKAISIIESHSTSQIDSLACSSTAASELKRELGKVPVGATATLTDVKETGTQAQAFMKVSMGSQSESFTMEMKQDGSKWCVSGI